MNNFVKLHEIVIFGCVGAPRTQDPVLHQVMTNDGVHLDVLWIPAELFFKRVSQLFVLRVPY